MKKIFLLLSFVGASLFSFAQNKFVSIADKNIMSEGRVVYNDNKASIVYPGTAFTIQFTGSYIAAELKNNAGYYNVQIDNQNRFKISTHNNSQESKSKFVLADNLSEGNHTLTLTLVSEGLFCLPEVYGFYLKDNSNVIKIKDKRKIIEFIGNSITCGYGVEAKDQNEAFNDSTSNFMDTYASITAKNINYKTCIVARSGIGVYRNFNDDPNGSAWPMSKVYFNTFITDSTKAWDFSIKPQIICIGLGTNDMSTAGYDKEKFTTTYVNFVNQVRKNNPNAHIVLMNSVMLGGDDAMNLYNCANNVELAMRMKGDTKVYRFNFTLDDGSLGYGADWHPCKAMHKKMAQQLTTFLKQTIIDKK